MLFSTLKPSTRGHPVMALPALSSPSPASSTRNLNVGMSLSSTLILRSGGYFFMAFAASSFPSPASSAKNRKTASATSSSSLPRATANFLTALLLPLLLPLLLLLPLRATSSLRPDTDGRADWADGRATHPPLPPAPARVGGFAKMQTCPDIVRALPESLNPTDPQPLEVGALRARRTSEIHCQSTSLTEKVVGP